MRPNWVPITEIDKLPPFDAEVLTWGRYGLEVARRWECYMDDGPGEEWVECRECMRIDVTHWAELLEGPECSDFSVCNLTL